MALARTIVRRTLSREGFSDGRRRLSHLDWIQTIAELTGRPVAADSILGVRPSRRPAGEYQYDIEFQVAEAAFFLGFGAGELTVRQVEPTRWEKPFLFRVWFGTIGGSVRIGTASFKGRGESALPWTPADFVGQIQWVHGGVGFQVPGVEVQAGAGFLHIYGSEILPPLMVLSAGLGKETVTELVEEGDPAKWKIKGIGGAELSIGVTGRIGHVSATRRLEVVDMTQSDPEQIYAAPGGGRRDIHFCFNSALLTPAARQATAGG